MATRMRGTLALCAALIAMATSACGGSSAGHASATATATPVQLDSSLATQSVYVATIVGTGTVNQGGLVALNAQSGAARWSFTPRGMAATPVLSGGAVYLAPEDGKVYALDPASGTPRWTYQRSEGTARTGYDGYSAVDGSVVYVTCDAGAVYALNTADGSLKWHVTLPNKLDHIYAAPAVGNGLVYVSVGGAEDELLALDAATGATRWTLTEVQEFDGVPLVANGSVYVGGSFTLYAVDATTGKVRWQFLTSGNILTRPAVGNGMVYVGSGDETVYALDAVSGTERWHLATSGKAPAPLLATGAAVTLDGGTLYVGSQGGTLYAMHAADGTVKWQRALDAAVNSPVTVTAGAVFVATDHASVYALRASDGAVSWHHSGQGSIFGSPVVG